MLPSSFFAQNVFELAPALVGCEIVHTTSDGTTAGIIVETEAYHQGDEASHSFRGKTKRNEVMFGPAGFAYIYFTYGMHYCMNVVAGQDGEAEAVLIRAVEPTQGIELMELRRGTGDRLNLCSGPAKLVQAMGLVPAQNGASLTSPQLHIKPRIRQDVILASPRIGIRQATEKPWRFFAADNPFVTKHSFNKLGVAYST